MPRLTHISVWLLLLIAAVRENNGAVETSIFEIEESNNQSSSSEVVPALENLNDVETDRKLNCGEECRLVVAYSESNECKIPETWSAFHDNIQIEENEIHQYVMQIFEKRINNAIQRKFENQSKQNIIKRSEETSVRIKARHLKRLSMAIVVVPAGLTTEEVLELSEDLPCVEFVSADYIKVIEPTEQNLINQSSNRRQENSSNLRTSNDETQKQNDENSSTERLPPNDPLFCRQWQLQDKKYGMKATSVWDALGDVPDITVAVLDSGCDLYHPDLKSRFWTNPDEICDDGIDNDKNGYIDDCNGWDFVNNDNKPLDDVMNASGHGTQVSGIIAAAINNAVGIAGLCPNCKIMCLRWVNGKKGSLSDKLAAINYALTKGVRISNNSYGQYQDVPAEFKAIQKAQEAGHIFVASAGNENRNTDLPEYFQGPSCYPLDNILSVGAYDSTGKKADFSDYGKKSVDLLAPGQSITTTHINGLYMAVSGTSFSAPIGAAAVAMIWSKYPKLSYGKVIESLVETCDTKDRDNKDWTRCGGIIDLLKALSRAKEK